MKFGIRILSSLIPREAKVQLREWRARQARALKAPRMIYGYRDASGTWRPRTRISDTVYLYHPERIFVQDNVFVWHHTILDGTGGVQIGEGVQLGAWVGIFTHSSHLSIRLYGSHYQEIPEEEKQGYWVKPVSIGPYAFIGSGAKILPGVKIGQGAVVAATAVVRHDVEAFQLVSGNPARVVGDVRKLDAMYLRDPQIREWWQEWQREPSPDGLTALEK